MGSRAAIALASLLLLSACSSSTPASRVADDQDVTRDILWDLRKDSRLSDVRVTCVDRTVTLAGTVPDRAALDEAIRVAARRAGSFRILSSLLVRAR